MSQVETQLASTEDKCAGVQKVSGVCSECHKPFEKWRTDQVTCGIDKCRKGKTRRDIRKKNHDAFIEQQVARRRAKSMLMLYPQIRGAKMRDKEACIDPEKISKDKKQSYSRCAQCGAPFLNSNDKPITSMFAFCGETLLTTGECKRKWLDRQQSLKPLAVKHTPAKDLGEKETGRTRMGRLYTNYCPTCKEYKAIDHECR